MQLILKAFLLAMALASQRANASVTDEELDEVAKATLAECLYEQNVFEFGQTKDYFCHGQATGRPRQDALALWGCWNKKADAALGDADKIQRYNREDLVKATLCPSFLTRISTGAKFLWSFVTTKYSGIASKFASYKECFEDSDETLGQMLCNARDSKTVQCVKGKAQANVPVDASTKPLKLFNSIGQQIKAVFCSSPAEKSRLEKSTSISGMYQIANTSGRQMAKYGGFIAIAVVMMSCVAGFSVLFSLPGLLFAIALNVFIAEAGFIAYIVNEAGQAAAA